MQQDIFITMLLSDKVKVKPCHIGSNLANVIRTILQAKLEGKCTHHGYIKKGSIKLYKYSMGQVISASLNGDVSFMVQYYADVCNPSIETVVQATVVNVNKFGILAECTSKTENQTHTVLEIIIAKNTQTVESEINLNDIKPGDMVYVEIMGKKFELNDQKISIVGRIVKEPTPKTNSKNKGNKITPFVEDEIDVEEDANDTTDDVEDDPEEDDEEASEAGSDEEDDKESNDDGSENGSDEDGDDEEAIEDGEGDDEGSGVESGGDDGSDASDDE